jgi:ADP-ribosyl-[dinitrogen reductase] hydrolase
MSDDKLQTPSSDPWDRAQGAILGMAVGDCVGVALEFKPPGTFKHVSDMVGGGPFELAVGEWTDDTSMALCLADSLLECNGFDPVDQLERYSRWQLDGYLSSKDRCFDIGSTVAMALGQFRRTRAPYCGSTDPNTAGNGSIMRLAPVPLYFRQTPEAAIARSIDSSRTTHAA